MSPDVNHRWTKEHYDLLESYLDGPRIWDATWIVGQVHELKRAGLLEPADVNGSSYRFRLTEAGREVLAARSDQTA